MPDAVSTVGGCAQYARRRLPRLEADLLVGAALGVSRSYLYAFEERAVDQPTASTMASWVGRRAAGEPVAYILGQRGFFGLDLEVTADALIPRADTETLVAAVLDCLGAGPADVLDVGTGCGAVALAIAHARPDARVVATDVDVRCAKLCKRNAERLGLNLSPCVADALAGIGGRFDAIVSNPPYVRDDDPHLQRGDLRFEPRRALLGGPDGLRFVAALVREAPARLRPNGWLCLEHGCDQAGEVARLMRASGLRAIAMREDLEGRPRATVGQRR